MMGNQQFQEEYAAAQKEFEEIQELVEQGILDREGLPEPGYWRWPILQADKLPEKFKRFIPVGEVRW